MERRSGSGSTPPDDAVGGSTVDEFKPRWLGGVPGGGAIRREEGEQPKLPRLPRLRVQDRVDAEGGPATICWGVGSRGRRLKCGEPVNDPRVVEEVNRLINEFLNRVEKHRGGVLLSGENTPFDESIKALSDWLQKIEEEIKESNDKNIANLRRTMLKVGRKMLMLAEQAREKWLKTYRQELEELIESLRSGRAKVIISGDPFNEDRSFVVHLYTENLTINVARVAKSGSITIEMAFTGLRGGTHIAVPKLFDENKLRAMQYGLLLTDGSIHKRGYPVMGTNQLWQAIAWLLAWPGRNHMYVDGVGINGNDVGIAWKLMAIDHKDEVRSKAEVAGEVGKLSSDDFVIFLLFAVLGDGDVDVEEKFVRLHMGESKRELWGSIIERLRSLGFRERDRRHNVTYMIWASRAVDLIRKMLGDSLIKALIEDLSALPDADKLRRLITLANMRVKPLGRSSIEVAGIKMHVHVCNNGFVELMASRYDYNDAVEVLTRLKNAGYEEVKLGRRGDRYVVYMGIKAIRKHPELVTKVCEVLRRMLEETVNEGKERRMKAITKAMTSLGCQ